MCKGGKERFRYVKRKWPKAKASGFGMFLVEIMTFISKQSNLKFKFLMPFLTVKVLSPEPEEICSEMSLQKHCFL